MNIVDQKGESHEVTGSGQGMYNTIAGSIGALGVLSGNNGGGLLGGLFGNNNGGASCSDNQPVNRYEMSQAQALSAKDSEIALLKAAQETDKKLVDVYATLAANDNKQRDRIDAVEKSLSAQIIAEREARLIVEKDQAVINQTLIGSTSAMSQQIKQVQSVLSEITTNVVPANKVCATGCCCCNG